MDWPAIVVIFLCIGLTSCASPQYAVRPAPVPDESPWAIQLERTISAYQARELERHGVRPVEPGERLFGFDVPHIVDGISRVTERPSLHYRVFLLQDRDPNAVSLADGRVYVTTGMLRYLASRGGRESELAFVLGHEIGHTVAQHLVKRYQELQREQLMLTVVGLGSAIATKQALHRSGAGQAGTHAQQLADLANQVANLLGAVAASGYSQEQELEADQLGIRYAIRAGHDPRAALDLLQDFARFETLGPLIAIDGVPVPAPFLRTHPYAQRRREDLARYLSESGLSLSRAAHPALNHDAGTSHTVDEARRRLLEAQRLYPAGSQSWQNIQRQLEELERSRR